ncbi:MAG TPA: hydroxymethylbilane synthase [Thermoanaerobaculia bacterium]|nr:hydroxymethylbilane synthase [Thermoanaerobaculia bacterium]
MISPEPPLPAARTFRLGTRRSALALAQSGMMARALEAQHPGLIVEMVPIVTTGDVVTGDLSEVGGKGLFTRELEQGLLEGSLDLAVHSLKDLPVTLPDGLAVAAFPERADPRDVLVSEVAADVDGLPEGAVVLTGALRRRAQLLLRRPDLQVEPIRGNVDTRLRKWRETGAGAVILAGAGLARLGLRDIPAHPLSPEVMVPAPGQGILALEVRAGGPAAAFVAVLNHPDAARAAEAERRVVAAFGGDCTLPLAAWARPEEVGGKGLRLTAVLLTPDGRHAARGEAVGEDPVRVAAACVAAMREDGAEEVRARIRQATGR